MVESDEQSMIAAVLPFVLASRRNVATAAAFEVHRRLRAITITDLRKLDSDLRHRLLYLDGSKYQWHQLTPERISLLERFGEASLSLLGLASFHSNGYVREAAIERLSRFTTGAELPFLILRLNDWVPEVRNAAVAAIRSRLTTEYCRSLVANLPLLDWLEYAGRADHQSLLATIRQILQNAACVPALFESLKSKNRFVRRASFRMALRWRDSKLPEVVALAFAEDDNVVRALAAQTVSSAFSSVFDQFRKRMLGDHLMAVRREALRIAVRQNLPTAVPELLAALFDRHASMREEARYHLQKIQPTDFAALYRQQLQGATGSTLYVAISGLGETGRAGDGVLIVPYTSHAASRIRRATIKALATLRPEAHVEIFLQALADEVPNVSRQAFKALARKTSLLSVARVWELFSSTPHAHVKQNALSLIERFTKWESISYLLSALCDRDQDFAGMAQLAVARWLGRFNRNFSSPTAEQVSKLKSALERCGRFGDEKMIERIQFCLRGF